jgi:hypothetical protein
MKIIIRSTADSLDPNGTSPNPQASLENYRADIDAAIRAEWPEADIDIIHEDSDDTVGIIVSGAEDSQAMQKYFAETPEYDIDRQIRDRVREIGEDIYSAGNFWVEEAAK